MKPFLVLAGFLLIVACARADGVYRWEDKNGKVYYGDRPAQDSVQVEQKNLGDQPLANDDLPYETRLASEKFPVVLYVSANCGDICGEARELLDKRGIPYTEKSLSLQQDIDAFKKLSGGEIVPTILVGKSWTKGFQADKWSSELDLAGYPKTSAHRNRPALTQSPASGPVSDEPATEETGAETPNPATPVEETPVEETPVEETPVEEAPATDQ